MALLLLPTTLRPRSSRDIHMFKAGLKAGLESHISSAAALLAVGSGYQALEEGQIKLPSYPGYMEGSTKYGVMKSFSWVWLTQCIGDCGYV